jgi:hypothetical protein
MPARISFQTLRGEMQWQAPWGFVNCVHLPFSDGSASAKHLKEIRKRVDPAYCIRDPRRISHDLTGMMQETAG